MKYKNFYIDMSKMKDIRAKRTKILRCQDIILFSPTVSAEMIRSFLPLFTCPSIVPCHSYLVITSPFIDLPAHAMRFKIDML